MEENCREENKYYDEYEIDLREYILLLWNNKWFIGGLCITAIVIAFVFSIYIISPVYQSNAKIKLSSLQGTYSKTETAGELLKGTDMISPVFDKLDIDYNLSNLQSYIDDNIDIQILSTLQMTENGMQGDVFGGILELTVKNSDPQIAKSIADGMIDNYKMKSEDDFKNLIRQKEDYIEELNTEIDRIEEQINKTNKILNEIEIENSNQVLLIVNINERLNNLENMKKKYLDTMQEVNKEINNYYPIIVLNPPYRPENPVSPNVKLNLAIAGVLALMLGVFIVFFKEFMKKE